MEPGRHAAATLAALALLVTTPAAGRAQTLTATQSQAQAAYDRALGDFKSVLAERRRQIEAKQPLPNLPGQALYLARVAVISTYKDLTDAVPSRIGKPNKFEIPPAYFDAAIEPLVDEYADLFEIMEAPPAARRIRRRRSRMSSISPQRLRAPKGLRLFMPTRRPASASGCSLPKPTASRTSAMRARTPIWAACRPARPRTVTASANGRRSRVRSRPPIRTERT